LAIWSLIDASSGAGLIQKKFPQRVRLRRFRSLSQLVP
jgi:hypothetical protein